MSYSAVSEIFKVSLARGWKGYVRAQHVSSALKAARHTPAYPFTTMLRLSELIIAVSVEAVTLCKQLDE